MGWISPMQPSSYGRKHLYHGGLNPKCNGKYEKTLVNLLQNPTPRLHGTIISYLRSLASKLYSIPLQVELKPNYTLYWHMEPQGWNSMSKHSSCSWRFRGSYVVIRGVKFSVTIIRGLITPRRTTHEPPSWRCSGLYELAPFCCSAFGRVRAL